MFLYDYMISFLLNFENTGEMSMSEDQPGKKEKEYNVKQT